MDAWALIIIAVSVVLYFISKKKPFFLFTGGIGFGLLWGALWASALIARALGRF